MALHPARVSLAVLALAAFVACDADGRGSAIPEDAMYLGSARILDNSEELGNPGALERVGHNLVVITSRADSAIRVIDPATGTLIRSFGRDGEGPGEFRSAWSLEPVRTGGDGVWIFDLRLQRLTFVDLGPDFDASRGRDARSIGLGADGPATGMVWMDDGELLASGYFSHEARFMRFDADGHPIRGVGPPPPGEPGTPATVRQHAYQSTMKRHPTRPLVALGTRHADRLEIYGPSGQLAAAAPRVRGFEPAYRLRVTGGNPMMETGEDLRFGYVDVAVNEHAIYALYSGHSRREAPGVASLGQVVYVFDWSGTLLQTLALDVPAFKIAVDPQGEHLYATRPHPVPAVVAYDLSPSPRAE
jgi:hypothetical protein